MRTERRTAGGGRTCRASGEAAVSDIIGSILLVAMTVAMAVALSLLLFSFDGPADKQYTNLGASLDPGPDGQWNTGNEEIRLTHLGGEPLEARGTTIRYTLGNTTTALSGSGLGSAFADGALTIGERWMRGATFALNDRVEVRVSLVQPGNGAQLLANAAVVAGSTTVGNICLGDVQAPTALLSQAPPDVTSVTTGAVVVQALLSDNCSGVAAAVVPSLWYCISASCPAPSNPGTGYTQLAMSRPDPTNQPQLWQASIPAPAPVPPGSWGVNVGKTITYYVYPLTDNAVPANTGRSATGTDPVNVFTQYKYAESHVDTLGTVANFPSLGADDGSEGSFTEGIAAGAAGTMTLAANAVVSSGTGWGTTGSAIGSDDNYATNANNNAGTLQLGYANPATNPGTITQVVVRAEANIAGAANDGWQLQACLAATCNALSATFTGTQADSTISYDVSAARPGGGSWSWTDINNLEVRITPVKSGSRDGTWQVDHATADVTYAPTYGMTIQLGFGTVQSGATHTLQLEYHIGAGSNSYNVQVATGCSPACVWTNQAPVLSSTTLATYSHVFTAAEVSAGYQVRIVSATQDLSQSQVFLDYARVATT